MKYESIEDLRKNFFKDQETCEHKNFERRKQILSNGSFQVKNQCLDCGTISQARKRQPGDENLPLVDPDFKQSKIQERQEEYSRIEEQLVSAKKQKMSAEYNEYLNTPEWQQTRKRVLARDGYICQGCLKNKAEVVHHKTYDNVRNEFAFELTSLCRGCHERYHNK